MRIITCERRAPIQDNERYVTNNSIARRIDDKTKTGGWSRTEAGMGMEGVGYNTASYNEESVSVMGYVNWSWHRRPNGNRMSVDIGGDPSRPTGRRAECVGEGGVPGRHFNTSSQGSVAL